MKTFRIERVVTVVQHLYIPADSAEEARQEAIDNAHLYVWNTSSENDPIFVSATEQP